MHIQQTIDSHMQQSQEVTDLFLSQGLSQQTIQAFQDTIWNYYQHNKRSFSWREHITPYRVVVSEIMLQQTQTDRVSKKFDEFVTQFPTFEHLATAPFAEVLKFWKGLGYNRRALNLQKIAQTIHHEYAGNPPNDPEILVTFPGIGKATAASITCFAYNRSITFIETNIRTIFIYFFFRSSIDVHDKELMPLIEKTLDTQNSREWYYALMDYGVMLKKNVGNLCRLSKHYAKQSKFEGSDRQIRGMVLQALLDQPGIDPEKLFARIERDQERIKKILDELIQEGFIKLVDTKLFLT
jgi:A/G-specific adenine glycosylase